LQHRHRKQQWENTQEQPIIAPEPNTAVIGDSETKELAQSMTVDTQALQTADITLQTQSTVA
jgi:hypothetical protein